MTKKFLKAIIFAKNSTRQLVIFSLIFLSGCASTSVPSGIPNGCGSGWSTYIVPDDLPLFACHFKDSCDLHDLCYSRCLPDGPDANSPICEYRRCREGGDLLGKTTPDGLPICENYKFTRLLDAARDRREICDVALGTNIQAMNRGKPICEAVGVIYKNVVRIAADSAFNGVMSLTGKTQSKEAFQKEIHDFLRNGSQQELINLIQSSDRNAINVDFSKPILYVPGEGLKNAP